MGVLTNSSHRDKIIKEIAARECLRIFAARRALGAIVEGTEEPWKDAVEIKSIF